MKRKKNKRLLTADELLEERLRFSEIDPHRRTATRIADEISCFRLLTDMGEEIEADQLSSLGKWLLAATPKGLRALADVIECPPTDSLIDARRANIVQSYFAAVYLKEREPTLAELKKCFLSYFNQQMLPRDYSIRKTLNLLGLPLGKAKRGRPVNSRSLIHNRKQ
jgi:hypothetical protein